MGLCIQKETNQLDYIIEDYTKSEITPDNDIVQLTENGRLIEYRGYDYNDSTSINMKLTFPVGNSITFLDLSYVSVAIRKRFSNVRGPKESPYIQKR